MPRIKTKHGIIKFKSVPLYPGVKRINKELSTKNLAEINEIFNSNNLPFQLAYGTVLGAMREHDFIDHDEDIDLAILDEYRDKFFEIIPKIKKKGFEICRFDRRDLISIMKNGEYIDLYFYKKWKPGFRICSGVINIEKHLINSTKIDFKGDIYNIPEDWDEYLVGEYGRDWRIPIQYNCYDMSYFKRYIFRVKELLKYILPNSIHNQLSLKAENRMIECRKAQLKKNLNIEIP